MHTETSNAHRSQTSKRERARGIPRQRGSNVPVYDETLGDLRREGPVM